jgi:hypothetical protein
LKTIMHRLDSNIDLETECAFPITKKCQVQGQSRGPKFSEVNPWMSPAFSETKTQLSQLSLVSIGLASHAAQLPARTVLLF